MRLDEIPALEQAESETAEGAEVRSLANIEKMDQGPDIESMIQNTPLLAALSGRRVGDPQTPPPGLPVEETDAATPTTPVDDQEPSRRLTRASATSQEREIPAQETNSNSIHDLSSFAERVDHDVKLAGESLIMGGAEFIDFVRKSKHWLDTLGLEQGGFKLPEIVVGGETLSNQAIADVVKDEYLSLKDTLGGGTKLEEVRDEADIFIKLLGENLGPSAGLNATRKSIQAVSKASDTLSDFWAIEKKIGFLGATTGAVAAGFAEGDITRKEHVAELFNVVGMVGIPALQAFSTPALAKKAYKTAKDNPLFGDEGYELSDRAVKKHLAKLVPNAKRPEIMERMRLIREVQKIEPDYKPTVGNMIGTEEAKAVQRMVDSRNYDLATEQYLKTEEAVKRLTARMIEDTDPANKAKIAAALSFFAEETKQQLKTSRDRLIGLEESLRRVGDPNYSAAQTGDEIRKEMVKVQDIYRHQRDVMANAIDPDNTAKFDLETINDRLDALVNGTDPVLRIREGQRGFEYASKELPAILKEMAITQELRGASGVGVALGFTTKEKPSITFGNLHAIYKQLGSKAADIAGRDPTSEVPRVLKGLQEDLLGMMDNSMVNSASPGIADRYSSFREFMTNEYYSRFQRGAGGQLTEKSGGVATVDLDRVGDTFWKSGDREVSMQEFNKIFSEAAEQISPGNKALLEDFGEMARSSLESHAINTLQNEIKGSKNSLAAVERWKHKFRGALKNFPEIQARVDEIEIGFRKLELDKDTFSTKEAEINNSIISKYTDTDPDEMIDQLYKMTPTEANQFINDILVQAQNTLEDPAFIRKAADLGVLGDKVAPLLDQSIRHSFMRHLVGRAYDANLGGPDWKKLDADLVKKKELIDTVLLPVDRDNLTDLKEVLKILGSENKPQTKADLNHIDTALKGFGISLASISSRYYSASLGKVGPLYLAVDAMTRVFTGMTAKHFDKVYRETMYDLDGLEAVLKHSGTQEAVSMVKQSKKAMRAALRFVGKSGVAGFQKALNPHMTLLGYRVTDLDRDADPKSTSQVIKKYLHANDDLTGQPSRIISEVREPAQDLISLVQAERKQFEQSVAEEAPVAEEGQSAILTTAPEVAPELDVTTSKSFVTTGLPSIVKQVQESGTALLPEVLMAMTVLETDWGKKAPENAFFGVKASAVDKDVVKFATKEADVEGNLVPVEDTFKAFNSFSEAVDGVITFLEVNPRYTKAGVFEATTAEEQIEAIAAAGFATDPDYAEKLIDTLDSVRRRLPAESDQLAN
jgi:flagellar protein FlgJ